MKCSHCSEDMLEGYFKVEKNFVYFQEVKNENEKIQDLTIPLVYACKCPTCKRISLFEK